MRAWRRLLLTPIIPSNEHRPNRADGRVTSAPWGYANMQATCVGSLPQLGLPTTYPVWLPERAGRKGDADPH